MISNAVKWQQKPETCRRKGETTAKTDQRIVRRAKIQPIITSRKIKDDLKLPVSAVTVRRHLIEAKLSARNPHKAPLLKKWHVQNRLQFGLKRKRCNILLIDESKIVLFFSGRVVVDSTSDDPHPGVLNSSHSTL